MVRILTILSNYCQGFLTGLLFIYQRMDFEVETFLSPIQLWKSLMIFLCDESSSWW